MNLGSFSISLSVKDIVASQAFYEKLGLAVIDGKQERRWLILRNGDAKIGLFQGMFEGNMLTFNAPDARSVQRALKDGGVTLLKEAEGNSGPAHVVVKDPDGNTILIDQI